MKNSQFCLLMATIYVAPGTSNWVKVIGSAVFLVGAAIEFVRERK
jgi:hypothetical protein